MVYRIWNITEDDAFSNMFHVYHMQIYNIYRKLNHQTTSNEKGNIDNSSWTCNTVGGTRIDMYIYIIFVYIHHKMRVFIVPNVYSIDTERTFSIYDQQIFFSLLCISAWLGDVRSQSIFIIPFFEKFEMIFECPQGLMFCIYLIFLHNAGKTKPVSKIWQPAHEDGHNLSTSSANQGKCSVMMTKKGNGLSIAIYSIPWDRCKLVSAKINVSLYQQQKWPHTSRLLCEYRVTWL